MNYEYKTVGAPERPRRVRGARSGSERFAAAFEEILVEEAVDGWEYFRTDTVPVTERAGWFSPSRTVNRAVLVFRRPLEAVWRRPSADEAAKPAEPVAAPAPPRREPALGPELRPVGAPEPKISADPDRRLAEIVRGPGPRPKQG